MKQIAHTERATRTNECTAKHTQVKVASQGVRASSTGVSDALAWITAIRRLKQYLNERLQKHTTVRAMRISAKI